MFSLLKIILCANIISLFNIFNTINRFSFTKCSASMSDSNKDVDGFVKDSKKIIEKAMGDIGKSSATKQLIIGTVSGWITGYIGMKVGKIAAVGLGGGVIILHLANENGYININWDKIHKNVDKMGDKIEKETNNRSSAWVDKVINFMKSNSYYSAGFTGGVLFGIASS